MHDKIHSTQKESIQHVSENGFGPVHKSFMKENTEKRQSAKVSANDCVHTMLGHTVHTMAM